MTRWPALALTFLPFAAHAATADITVRDAAGNPLTDAVVMLETATRPSAPIHFPWGMSMAQENIAFVPHVLIVPVGTTVAFPNHDRVRHHVYSFSKAKKFDIKLYGRDETRSETFNTPGVVALGCNIHDRMSGFIIVVDTPYVGQTDAKGRVHIEAVPAGRAQLRVWSPSLRAPGNQATQSITISGANFATTMTARR